MQAKIPSMVPGTYSLNDDASACNVQITSQRFRSRPRLNLAPYEIFYYIALHYIYITVIMNYQNRAIVRLYIAKQKLCTAESCLKY